MFETLKTLKWRPLTKHYKQALMPGPVIPQGHLMVHNNQWYLVRNDEVARLPLYAHMSLAGKHELTHRWGPYAFYNFFEKTPEAHYLMKMFRYKILTSAPEKKIHEILERNKDWISIDDSFVEALIEREGCPDYWREPGKKPEVMDNETYQKIQEVFNGNKN